LAEREIDADEPDVGCGGDVCRREDLVAETVGPTHVEEADDCYAHLAALILPFDVTPVYVHAMTAGRRRFPVVTRPEHHVLIGGPEPANIVLVPHDPAWASRYAHLWEGLVRELAGIAVRIEHVGSTAVPGLDAKPIIDIQVGVPDPDDEPRLTPRMEKLGYHLRVREPGEHRMYRNAARDVHVHMWFAGSHHERRHLVFRDWLRRSPEDRALYAATKHELAGRPWESMSDYAFAKDDVIGDITARAEAWARATGWALPPAFERHRE
jgi:GrpB-like predicted nucleotidyltransferase (UPF0157 family)